MPPEADARAWLAGLAASGREPDPPLPAPPASVRALLEAAAKDRPPAPWPEGLVARPSPLPGAAWHLRCLERVLAAPPPGCGPRAAYHARWLGHFLWPDDPGFVPRISVVIPVYNRAGMAAEAVASALALDWPAVEVVVVDDGSSDALDAALAPFGDRVRVWHQPNRGVAAARNRGVALAGGELLNFLDSDNLLDADAARRWIAGLRAVPDADLCFSQPRLAGDPALVAEIVRRPWPTGEPRCPTQDFLAAASRAHPFLNAGVLTARWIVLAAGPFDERLRRGEDTRFWFQLGLAGVKAAGLKGELNTRRVLVDSLTRTQTEAMQGESLVPWLNLIDLLRTPPLWRLVPVSLRRTQMFGRWASFDRSDDPIAASVRALLVREVAGLAPGAKADALSPRPLLLVLRGFTRQMQSQGRGDAKRGLLQAPLLAAAEAALARCPAADSRDFFYWLDALDHRADADVLRILLADVDASARLGRVRRSFADLARLHARAPDPAAGQRWKALARLEQLLGTRATRGLLRIAGRPLWRLDPPLRSLRLFAAAGHRARSAAWRLNAARRRTVARLRARAQP